MTLQEAIKSGKRFRRKGWPHWFLYPGNSMEMRREDFLTYYPDKPDILADDWELEEMKVEITRQQLYAAADASEHILMNPNPRVGSNKFDDFLDAVAKELGL